VVFHGQAGHHFGFHEGTLIELEVEVLGILLEEVLACVCIYLNFIQVSNVLSHEPLNREDRDLLSSSSVELLALGPEFKPRLRRKIDCFADIESR